MPIYLLNLEQQLNRNPEDYNDANHQPHVLVALRNNSDNANSKKYKSGDVVSYIICEVSRFSLIKGLLIND